MGRPKKHDAATRTALLDAAERLVSARGLAALSVRAVADEVGTTTRAIYTVFGSMDGLVDALGARTFELLGPAVRALPVTADPAADLVAAGAVAFRHLVLTRPVLFALGVQRVNTTDRQNAGFQESAAQAWTALQDRVIRLQEAGGLGQWPVSDAALAFHVLCEGLAAAEMRGMIPPHPENLWHHALKALVTGFRTDTDDPIPVD